MPPQSSRDLDIVMPRWECRLIPSLYSPDVGTCALDFAARCLTDPFHGLEV